ncbi:hypothetical protein PFISCL1PPCAC_9002, partial [Pristionchus fissidentatus]
PPHGSLPSAKRLLTTPNGRRSSCTTTCTPRCVSPRTSRSCRTLPRRDNASYRHGTFSKRNKSRFVASQSSCRPACSH